MQAPAKMLPLHESQKTPAGRRNHKITERLGLEGALKLIQFHPPATGGLGAGSMN